MATIAETLNKLKKSKFRSQFHLSAKEKAYVKEKGLEVIKKHCQEIIRKRLAPKYIHNDGKQTPLKGHPVFIAQHACACCCRNCLEKWYKVSKDNELTKIQQEKIVNLLMAWIEKELD